MADEIIVKVRADVNGLQADIQDAKKIVDTGVSEIEKNSIDLKVDTKSTESLRTQIRKAQQEVAELSLKFGATSKAATEAALRASALKDRLEDAKNLTDAFNPDAKFKALSGSLQGVAGGFTAVQGAIGAFGTKSEDVEKALLKVNSAMALSQGLQSVGESVDSFKNLGAVIKNTTAFQFLYNTATATATAVQTAFGVATTATSTGFKVLRGAIMATGIGALVVTLGLVVSNFDSISAWIKNSPLGSFANQVGNLVERFTDFIGITSEAERSLDKISKVNARANESIKNRIDLLKAQGGSEKEIYKLSQQSIENNLQVLRKTLSAKGKLTDEESKQFRDLKNQQLVVSAEYNKKVSDDQQKANEKAADAAKKAAEQNKKNKEEELAREKKYQNDLQKFTVDQFEKESKIQQDAFDATLTAQQLEERAVKDKYFQQIEEARQYGLDTTILEQKKTDELKAINDKYFKERQDAENKQIEDQKKVDQISIKNFQEAEDKKAEILKQRFEQQKAQLNEILSFAQNGILLQIGLNPQEVERVKSGILNAMTVIKDNQKVLDDVNATAAEQSKARLENLQAVSQAIASGVSSISNAIFASDKARREQELADLQVRQEEELRLAGDNEQKKDLIRQKYALKEKEIKRKQAEADKRKAIFDAIVGTAVAVIGALPNFVLAAIVGALGAAQIAVISAQPIPKFAKGGAVPSSDIQGIIDGRPHSAGGVLIEAEGNEFITRKSQAMKGDNLGLLEAINMSDSERDAYINRHYVMPALKAKESKANESYRHSMIEAENNLIARVSSHTLKSIHREQKNTTEAVNRLSKNNYSW